MTESHGHDVTESGRRSIIASIATDAARRWKLTLAVLVVVLIAGVSAYSWGLDREGFPPVNTPIAVVTGTYFVDDADTVDLDVVQPLVSEFESVDGVVSVESTARPSSFSVIVEFESDMDADDGTQRLVALDHRAVDGAEIAYNPFNAAKIVGRYDVVVSIVGPSDATSEQLQSEAAALAAYLSSDGSVGEADVRELVTESVDPATGDTIERTTRFTRVAFDDTGYRDAIAIGIVRAGDADLDVLAFTDRIDALLADGDSVLDVGYDASITADFARGIRQQLSSLTSNLVTGLLAVALVSLVLIGWRVAVMTTGFMVVVMLGALVGLWVFGYSLNTITLFGLILTLGLLVDDAIVISESIDASRDDPDPGESTRSLGVIRSALERVGSASFAGTLTTVVVFSPMLFVGGILGEYIRSIPATVIITLLISFAFSIVFIPAVARVFLLNGGPSRNPVVAFERRVGNALGRLAAYPWRNGWSGRLVGGGLVALAFVAIVAGGMIAGSLPFSIFPVGKDATGLSVSAEFPPGTTIEQAEVIASEIDNVVLGVLGDGLERSQYVRGNERTVVAAIELTPLGTRPKAPALVEEIELHLDDLAAANPGLRLAVGQVELSPEVGDYPFAVQIEVDRSTAASGERLAADIEQFLLGQNIESGGELVVITDSIISTDGQISRIDGQRFIEVRASYSTDQGVTGLLTETQALVEDAFPAAALDELGVSADALTFDFGIESDNQDDFAGLLVAGVVALGLMLVLIAVQFRSLAQALLIFLAIPLSFLGVFGVLKATDNPQSFLSSVGFIALIGVAVNNTILLVDSANQRRRAGMSAGEAIQGAVSSRFRPLVATTVTTVAGLLPLALSDPFWESLGFTLMGGLVSSTLLVLVCFPAFYLALESVRTPLRNAVRRRQGRPLLT